MSLLSMIGGLYGWFSGQSSQSSAPNYADVCMARTHLKALKLPMEIILQILDYAEYWPEYEFQHRRTVGTNGRHGGHTAAAMCFSEPLYDNALVNQLKAVGETPKIKSIEFEVESTDQGWTSEDTEGTYNTSSWVEVSILRDMDRGEARQGRVNMSSTPLDYHNSFQGEGLVKRPASAQQGPQDGEGDLAWYLQGNRVAAGYCKYRILWTEDGSGANVGNEGAGSGEGFIRELRDGDKLILWARAKYAGWQCMVKSVDVRIRYGL